MSLQSIHRASHSLHLAHLTRDRILTRHQFPMHKENDHIHLQKKKREEKKRKEK